MYCTLNTEHYILNTEHYILNTEHYKYVIFISLYIYNTNPYR